MNKNSKGTLIVYDTPITNIPDSYIIGIDPYSDDKSDKVNNLGNIEIVKKITKLTLWQKIKKLFK